MSILRLAAWRICRGAVTMFPRTTAASALIRFRRRGLKRSGEKESVMRQGFIRTIAVAVLAGMAAITGATAANAGVQDDQGSGWTATATPNVAANTVQQLHDQLKATYENRNLLGIRGTLNNIDL